MAKKSRSVDTQQLGADGKPIEVNQTVLQGIDRVLSIHRPVVLAHIRALRKRHSNATPQQLIAILERRYLTAVTTGGAAVGATAAVPAIGTGASLALTGVETLGFLEASALFAQSVTEVHGIAVEDPDRARALVMSLMMGSSGSELVQQLAKQAGGSAAGRPEFWGALVTKNLPQAAIGPLADRLKKSFIKSFLARTGSTTIGRMLPFGVGAVIGGVGNHALGSRVVKSSRTAFGPAPLSFPAGLEPVVRMPKAPKPPKPQKQPKQLKQVGQPKEPKQVVNITPAATPPQPAAESSTPQI